MQMGQRAKRRNTRWTNTGGSRTSTTIRDLTDRKLSRYRRSPISRDYCTYVASYRTAIPHAIRPIMSPPFSPVVRNTSRFVTFPRRPFGVRSQRLGALSRMRCTRKLAPTISCSRRVGDFNGVARDCSEFTIRLDRQASWTGDRIWDGISIAAHVGSIG